MSRLPVTSARPPSARRAAAHRRPRRALSALTALFLAVTGLTALALTAAAPANAAVAGTIAGRVFEDYNANGVRDAGSNTPSAPSATDAGVPGVSVTVTDSTGATVGTGSSGADGTFNIDVTTSATSAVRVVIAPPTGYAAGPHGTDSGTTVQFVTLGSPGASAVDVGLSRQGDYSQSNPRVLNATQIAAIGTSGNLIDRSTKPSLVSSAYSDRGTTAPTTEALVSQTGTVWGAAALGTKYAFTAASFKRHAPVGPGGLGAVYLTDLASAPNATPWVTIPNAGTSPRTNEAGYTFDQWFHDTAAYPQVGKIGLGGVALAPDHTSIFVVNLNDKTLYRVPFTLDGNGAPVAGTPAAIELPIDLPGAGAGFGCASDDIRPYGVDTQNGAVWVTLTCTGPLATDLHGYVYRYDVTTQSFGSSPAFETTLSGYARGSAYVGCPAASCPATWHVWPATDTTFPTFSATNNGRNRPAAYAEPVLSSVVFDSDGDMTVGVKDRFSDQIGYQAGDLTAGDNDTFEGFSAGDTLRACGNAASGWTLEANASCGSRTGSGPGDSQGPSGGEFYYDDVPGYHNQVTLGSLLQLPGYGEVVSTAFDPNPNGAVRTSGTRFLSNTNGGYDSSHQLIDPVNANGTGVQGSFSKAGGLGDVAALVDAAPVEIGNRVWRDTNYDGIQDAGEPALEGVTVDLFTPTGTTPLATAVTDANGNYYFSSAAGDSTTSSVYGLDALQPATAYQVKLDRPADFSANGPLDGLVPTATAAGDDTAVDSNGAIVTGVDQASVTTGAAGVDDHTIDFGFVAPTYAVGDFVWKDTNKNGIQDTGEPGVAGVTVTLRDADNNQAHHADGSLVAAVQTDNAGRYSFDFLAAGTYQASFTTLPTGYVLTAQSTTGSTPANDSNPATTTGLTPTFAIGASAANMRAVQSGDGVTRAVAINPTIDAGIVAGDSVSVGDFVWNDTNRNGVQDTGEPGINGVTVTLTGPGGAAVIDIFGHPVSAVTTSGNGGYLFPNLSPLTTGQSYTTHVDNSQAALSGFLPTVTGQGTSATDSSTGQASSGDLTTGGSADLTLDYGFVTPTYAVGDFVWKDTNKNGVQDSGEPGVAGVTVMLVNADGSPAQHPDGMPVFAVQTDSAGHYAFDFLAAGNYQVSFTTLPTGYALTTQTATGSTPANDSNPATTTGLTPTFAIGASAANMRAVQSGDGVTRAVAINPTIDAGIVVGAAVSVGDFVWQDSNHNGVQDTGEPGINGVTVTVTGPGGGAVTDIFGHPVPAVTTSGNGGYLFPNLPPLTTGQSYTTHVDNGQAALSHFLPTATGKGSPSTDSSTAQASSGDLTTGGSSDLTLDYGFVQVVSVGDFVWDDSNHDGVQDSGEPGINGVTVTLTGPGGGAVTDVFGAVVGPVTTSGDGEYLFPNLPPLAAGQSYTTHVDNSQDALSDYVPTVAGKGTPSTDSSTAQASSGDLTTGGSADLTLDYGFIKPVSVGDFVWVDTNHNGIQDAGEQGIPDVVLTLTDKAGNPVMDLNGVTVGSQTTGSLGEYEFTNLPPGQYVVHLDDSQPALSGYTSTDAGKGDDRAEDSSTGQETSTALVGGESDQTLDFGFVNDNGADSSGGHHGSSGGGSSSGGSDNSPAGLSNTGTPLDQLLVLMLTLLIAGCGLTLATRRRNAYVGTRRRT